MNRLTAAAAGLVVVLVLVLYWMFVWSPKSERVGEIEAQIEQTIARQQAVQRDIAELEEVRSRVARLEAGLAASQSIVPRDSGLPGALRQLQLAAQDAGATLVSVQPGRPAAVEEAEVPGQDQLASLPLSVQVRGGYFQLVDFLRRVEDPTITPRGIAWEGVTVSSQDYPVLDMSLAGEMYALLPSGGDGEGADAGPSPGDGSPDADQTPSPTEDAS